MSVRINQLASRTFWSLTVLTLSFSAACFVYADIKDRQAIAGYPPDAPARSAKQGSSVTTAIENQSGVAMRPTSFPTTLTTFAAPMTTTAAPTTTMTTTTTYTTTASDAPTI